MSKHIGPRNYRSEVISFLEFLSSLKGQELTTREVPPEELVIKFCQLWFDDIFIPGGTYLDALKGDVPEESIEEFWSQFNVSEQDALAFFHRFFELRLQVVTKNEESLEGLYQSEAWGNIIKDAELALAAFSENGYSVRDPLKALAS